jgi:hypothetical protein
MPLLTSSLSIKLYVLIFSTLIYPFMSLISGCFINRYSSVYLLLLSVSEIIPSVLPVSHKFPYNWFSVANSDSHIVLHCFSPT